MKYPYGIYDFKEVITENYFYCDRTHLIPMLEKAGKSILFLRPRRFGKTLLLSMLENYYDIKKKDMFDKLFGRLKIAQKPTELRNKFFILKLDFSCVDSNGSIQDVKQSLYDHVNDRIIDFNEYYKELLPSKAVINPKNALSSISSLLSVVKLIDISICLLIDEYDNFANELMLTKIKIDEDEKDIYTPFVTKDGPLKTVFKSFKSGSNSDGFAKTFITGVSPVVLSDISSGYNIAKNKYLDYRYNTLCGFTEPEIRDALKQIIEECDLDDKIFELSFDFMKAYYNGYKFSVETKEYIYNPTMCLYFFEEFYENCKFPREMLDDNLAVDFGKIKYAADLAQGRRIVFDLCEKNASVEVSQLKKRFGVEELLSDKTKDNQFIISYLYYVGTLTHVEETNQGKLKLQIPNLVMKSLYIDRVQEMLFPAPGLRDEGKQSAEKVYRNGDLKPICTFLENHYFKTLSNRDYVWANELTVKMAFLTLLYDDILYIMDSELEIKRTYIDLTMIIRPDRRHLEIFDVLIEFKYIPLSDAKMTGEMARNLTKEELEDLPCVKKKFADAKIQAQSYAQKLNQKYNNLKLRSFAVVSLGFDRLCWEEI